MSIKIYHSYISEDDTLLPRLWDALPAERREQLAARTLAARAEGAALTALLQAAIAAWPDTDGGTVCTVETTALTAPYPVWEVAANGKPFADGIPTPAGRVFPAFSHSHGHLLVVLADRPCGADIQTWDVPAFAPARLARTAARIAHPADPPVRTAQEAARHFARKEAVLKLDGCGLRRPLSSVSVTDMPVLLCEDIPSCIIAVAVSR